MSSLIDRQLAHALAGQITPQWMVDRSSPHARGLVTWLDWRCGRLWPLDNSGFGEKLESAFGTARIAQTSQGMALDTLGDGGLRGAQSEPVRAAINSGVFTIAMRVRVTSFDTWGGFFTFAIDAAGSANSFSLQRNAGAAGLIVGNATAAVTGLTTDDVIAAGWTTLVLTRQASGDVAIYLDGVARGTAGPTGTFGSAANAGGRLVIAGDRLADPVYSTNLQAIFFSIWNRALDAREVSAFSRTGWREMLAPPALIALRAPLSGSLSLAPAKARHALSSDQAQLTGISGLAGARSVHGHSADSGSLIAVTALSGADGVLQSTSDHTALVAAGSLSAAKARHGHSGESVSLGVLTVLAGASADHASRSSSATLTLPGQAQTPRRRVAIQADGRASGIARDGRAAVVITP